MIAFFAAWQNLEEKCAGEGLMASNINTLQEDFSQVLIALVFAILGCSAAKFQEMTNKASRPYK